MDNGIHIAFVMDGNRRWAKSNGFSIFEGYKKGFYVLKDIVYYALRHKESNIKYISAFAFSKDNWKRDLQQVNLLMSLIYQYLNKEVKDLLQGGIKLKLIGDDRGLSNKLRESFYKMEQLTKDNDNLTLLIAVNYSGRDEIINAIKKMYDKKIDLSNLDIEEFEKYLYLYPFPAPDILVRTSQANRLSDFFLWHAAYTELYFLNKFWPEFTMKDLEDILEDYKKKPRRFGK